MRRKVEEPLQWGDDRCAAMTAAIYVRKSTETEGRSKSRDRQLSDCQRDAKSFGFREVVVYMEEEGLHGEWWFDDHAGRNPLPHREKLTDLVDDIEAGKIGAVLVYKPDRLTRDNGINDALAKIFRRFGVHFICHGRDTEISTARGLYQVAVDAASSRQWRDQISEDIIADHAYKFKLKMLTRNPSCFGFRSNGWRSLTLRPVHEELDIARRIYRMFLGIGGPEYGAYQIARIFMEEGVNISSGCKGHKVKDPNRVYGSSIRQILKNPMYAGLWQHNGETAPYDMLLIPPADGVGEPTTAIPYEWYLAAKEKLATGGDSLGTKGALDKRPLAGLVVCGCCGRPCHANTKNRKSGDKTYRWFCPNRTGPMRDCWGDSYRSLVVDSLDEWVTDHLAVYLAGELNLLDGEGGLSRLREDTMRLERLLSEAKESETAHLKRALKILDDEQLAALAQELRNDRRSIEAPLLEVKNKLSLAETKASRSADLISEDPVKVKAALRRLVRWIAITDKGVTVLTSTGCYIGATYSERDMSLYGSASNRRSVNEPTPVSVASCLSWIANPVRFVEGRRDALGKSASRLTDDELLPGARTNNEQEDNAA